MEVDYEIKVGKGINCHAGRQEVGRCRTWGKSEESIIWSGWSRQVGRSSWLKTQGSFYQKSKTGLWTQEEGEAPGTPPAKSCQLIGFAPKPRVGAPRLGNPVSVTDRAIRALQNWIKQEANGFYRDLLLSALKDIQNVVIAKVILCLQNLSSKMATKWFHYCLVPNSRVINQWVLTVPTPLFENTPSGWVDIQTHHWVLHLQHFFIFQI